MPKATRRRRLIKKAQTNDDEELKDAVPDVQDVPENKPVKTASTGRRLKRGASAKRAVVVSSDGEGDVDMNDENDESFRQEKKKKSLKKKTAKKTGSKPKSRKLSKE